MKESDLRQLVLDHSKELKSLMLTERQKELLWYHWFCRERSNSNYIADVFNITIQSATQQLKKLYDMGYLDRENVGSPTGGNEYEYFLTKGLKIK